MKRVLFALALLAATPLFGIDVDPKLDKATRETLPVCAGANIRFEELPVKLPARFTGTLVRVESADHHCDGQYAAVLSPAGGFFLGSPWPLTDLEGKTLEEKLQNFTILRLQEHMTVTVDRTRSTDGLFKVTLHQLTESGKMPLEGEVDPDGKIFFLGRFRPANVDVRTARLKSFESILAKSPTKGAAAAPVTIVEFSDFQCPSCMRAAGYVDPILAKHGEKVRYIRYDLPLAGHSWAFAAALAGRAIYQQKPELFWDYKKAVYANQGDLNAMMIWDWARNFASDHELDLAKYDATLNDESVKAELLKAAGMALSNEVRGTPSYMVNGAMVEAGTDGKQLAAYVDQLVAAK